jgi:ABC-type nitrate/sulfonate/bicarbonate transport system substrate-binding protein
LREIAEHAQADLYTKFASIISERRFAMFAKKVWLILVMTLFAVQVNAEQIKIAYSGVSAAGTPLWLAKDEGIFGKHGLEADLVAVRSAPVQVTALVSNEVQFVRGSVSSMLTAAAQGASSLSLGMINELGICHLERSERS